MKGYLLILNASHQSYYLITQYLTILTGSTLCKPIL